MGELHELAGGADAGQQIFCKEGEYWTIVYDGTVARLRSTKGLHYIAHLLRNPGARTGAAELQAGGNNGPSAPSATDEASRCREHHRVLLHGQTKGRVA